MWKQQGCMCVCMIDCSVDSPYIYYCCLKRQWHLHLYCNFLLIWFLLIWFFFQGVNDIQGFVTVALATAAGGEDDLTSDKLSHLRTVGSGYASLIYEVKELDGYKKLKDKCKHLWDALEKNGNLPELLVINWLACRHTVYYSVHMLTISLSVWQVSCNNDIEWYKCVKETQSSVETTSYGQMSNILKYGTYRVGFKKNAQTVHDLISVSLSRRCQKVVKWKYSLDELRDLESKLVLICGNKAEKRAEVDHYLNVSKYLVWLVRSQMLADKFKCECCLYILLWFTCLYILPTCCNGCHWFMWQL